jgi:hypothetical protein
MIIAFEIWNFKLSTILDINMVYMKVIVINTIYNFIIEKIFI